MRRINAWCGVLALGWLMAGWASAGTLSVAPTTVDMRSDGFSTFYVINRGDAPTLVQVEPFDWTQVDGHDRLAESSMLQVSPPIAQIEPGQRQLIRLRVPVSAGGEHSYRLLVSQLPDRRGPGDEAVRVLLQFSVPVFAGTSSEARAELQWRIVQQPGGALLEVTNTGATRAKFLDPTLLIQGRAPVAVAPDSLTYVLAGATRSWRLGKLPLTPDSNVQVRVQPDGQSAPTLQKVVVVSS